MLGREDRSEEPRPRVSIGVPVFNARRYLDEALSSLLAQDFKDLEIVISDNASTDGTWELCERYASMDDRVRCYRNDTNLGAARNYNRTVELARGELFKWAAYDDICAPTFISKCVHQLDKAGPRAVLAYPRTILVDDRGDELGAYRDQLDLRSRTPRSRVAGLAWNVSLCNAVMGLIRMDALQRTGLIRSHISSDITLLAELAALGEFHEVPERLFSRRIHPLSSRQGQPKKPAAIAEWFDTSKSYRVRPKARVAWRTPRALASSDLSTGNKILCATTFATVWSVRRAHIQGSRLKRRLVNRQESGGDSGHGRHPVNARRLDTQPGETS